MTKLHSNQTISNKIHWDCICGLDIHEHTLCMYKACNMQVRDSTKPKHCRNIFCKCTNENNGTSCCCSILCALLESLLEKRRNKNAL